MVTEGDHAALQCPSPHRTKVCEHRIDIASIPVRLLQLRHMSETGRPNRASPDLVRSGCACGRTSGTLMSVMVGLQALQVRWVGDSRVLTGNRLTQPLEMTAPVQYGVGLGFQPHHL